ncbi:MULTISPECIES: Bcr/CflA family multidrug efflux MFS transporter [unclassified Pseudomonas]|uniref:Bcr/CflA family multidrug efflux MFS transporter n=1 Tax=unclassified Pseudomonas TaxID=196821 RepID=UPI001865A4B2|nr:MULTISPECIES: Bcr/CflA family multidrug efflux MFS transporter [unclassified Pseudomonas]
MSSLGPAETERNAGSPSDVPRTTNNVWLMLNLSALMSFASISTDMYLPALPAISRALHTDSAGVELTFSAFLIGFSLGQLIWGPISDRFGRKFPILIGMVLFIIGSVGCALSTTVTEMMVWRVVQALGACVGPVLSRAMVRDLYGREQSAKMLSTLILIMGVAPIAGPLVGGQILLLWSWPAIFWALAIVGLVTLFSFGRLPESLPPKHRTREPLRHTFATYLQLIRDPRLIGYALSGGFFYGGAYAFIVGTPFAYIDFYQVSPQAYGWLFGVNIVGMMIANFINGRLLSRMSSEQLFYRGAWTLAFFGVVLSVCVLFGWGGIWGLVIPIFFYMSMNGLIVANSVAGALAFFPHRAGSASSLVGAMHYGSGIFSAALVSWLADGTPKGMALVMGGAGIGCLVAALWSKGARGERS